MELTGWDSWHCALSSDRAEQEGGMRWTRAAADILSGTPTPRARTGRCCTHAPHRANPSIECLRRRGNRGALKRGNEISIESIVYDEQGALTECVAAGSGAWWPSVYTVLREFVVMVRWGYTCASSGGR